jgi:alanyl-tRNA synthetase
MLSIADKLKTSREGLEEKLQQLVERNRQLEKELDRIKSKLASVSGNELLDHVVEVSGIKLLVTQVDELDGKGLRDLVDQLRNKLQSGVIVLASIYEGRVNLIVAVSKDLTSRIKAGDLINQVAVKVGGKGGGRPDLAQAGGSDVTQVGPALAGVPALLSGLLG